MHRPASQIITPCLGVARVVRPRAARSVGRSVLACCVALALSSCGDDGTMIIHYPDSGPDDVTELPDETPDVGDDGGSPGDDAAPADAEDSDSVEPDDGTPPSGIVGDPCVGPEDCGEVPSDSRYCLQETVGYAWPEGYCSAALCTDDSDCGPAVAACVPFGGAAACLRRCDGASDCRTGYSCAEVAVFSPGTAGTYCVPSELVEPPSAPIELAATAETFAMTSFVVHLRWTDTSDDEGGFAIERSTACDGGFEPRATVGAGVTTFDDPGLGLEPETSYCYRVAAFNGFGNSAYSNTAEVTTPTMSRPAAPSGLSATASSSSTIALAWTDNSHNETGFRVARSSSCTGSFADVGSVAADVTSFSDSGLSASTFYCYRVEAYNHVGSAASNTAGATTLPPAVTRPAAPTALSATAATSTDVVLSWTDHADNETGFDVERAPTCASGFAVVGSTAANVTSYHDGGRTASTSYCYRVAARNAAGASAYSNTSSVTTPAPPRHQLEVIRTGLGAGGGSVTGTGIACGTDCSEDYAPGTTVTLSATATGDSVFSSWTGCDSASGASCTVTMNASRGVTAAFGMPHAFRFEITSLPATDSDGNYSLTFRDTGVLSCSPHVIQEDSDLSFSSPTNYLDSTPGTTVTHSFTGKADGTYCYRVGCTGYGYSEPACIVVARPTVGTLRVRNNTHYYLVDIRLNGTQQVDYPYGIEPGGYYDFVRAPGTVSYAMGSGFYDESGGRDVWFTLTGSASVTVGSTATVTFSNPTIAQMLTNFGTSRDWVGYYYCYSGCPLVVNEGRFRFLASGGWELRDNGTLADTGTVSLVAWYDLSTVIEFRLCSTCESIYLWHPFSQFFYRNGPDYWPSIEYNAR